MWNRNVTRATITTALLLTGVIIGVLPASRATLTSQQGGNQQLIPQPAEWVEFSAQLKVFHPGQPEAVGRFFRDLNGSTRLETGPTESDIKIISINNYSSRLRYVQTSAVPNRWRAEPINIPNRPWAPIPRRVQTTGLTKLPERITVTEQGELLPISKGVAMGLSETQFFEAFHYVNAAGNFLTIDIPALNFFSVLKQNSASGRREVYFNIKSGPQPAELFEPTPGEPIEQSAEGPTQAGRRVIAPRK
jgi:hypothetical protein